MVKQSPSRNHRSKGIKVKHVLQICVLVAICFWLVYQVKHSHNKKKAFQEHDAKMSVKTHISDEVLKFGRKDLQPRLEETTIKHDKLDEAEEEEEEEEETGRGGKEGNKNEEEEQEEDNNNEEKEDDAKGGDDEIDDQEKIQLDDEPEEDLIDGEKDREESDEKEAAENDSEDKEGRQNGNTSSLEDHDRDGGGSSSTRNAHETREENYRADDASSAVTHETQTDRGTDNSNDNTETNIIEEEGNKSINTTGLKVERGGMGEDGNMTGKVDKGSEIGSFELEGGSHLNSAMETEFNNQPEIGNNLLLQNETETRPETDEAQNSTVKNQSSTDFMISSNTGNVDAVVAQNATVKDQSITNFMISNNTGNADAIIGESSNPTEFAVPEKVKTFNTTSIAVERHSGSLTTEENADRSWSEHDSSESSIPLEEKDVRSNGTFPEITTERTNNGDAAAQ